MASPVAVGQRRHDDDDLEDPSYGERNYTITALGGRRDWDGVPNVQWWKIRYDDGHESEAPATWIRRDTLVSEAVPQ